MKNVFFALAFLFFSQVVVAQDYIVKRNGEEIYCIIKEITINEVKYVDTISSSNILRSIAKSEILFIRYRNGSKEMFNNDEKEDKANAKQVDINPITGLEDIYPILDLGSNDYSINGKMYSFRQIKQILLNSNNDKIRHLLVQAKVSGLLGNILGYSSIPIGYIGFALGVASLDSYGDVSLAPVGATLGIICIGANVSNILLKVNKRKKINEAIQIYNKNIEGNSNK
jgi:hypothetical protein